MNQKMQLSDWKVDNSAGRPILTYKGCSVIEAEDAEFVLGAIKVALGAVPAPNLRDCIVEVLREHHEVKRIGALADRLEAALSPAKPEPSIPYELSKLIAIEVDIEPREPENTLAKPDLRPQEPNVTGLSQWEGWDASRGFWSQTKHRDAVMHAMFRGPWSMEDAATLLGFIDRTWPRAPKKEEECRQDLDKLEFHLTSLMSAHPKQARLAEIDDITRTWFVAELIKVASGRIPLTEIEALVSRHLAAAKGGEA